MADSPLQAVASEDFKHEYYHRDESLAMSWKGRYFTRLSASQIAKYFGVPAFAQLAFAGMMQNITESLESQGVYRARFKIATVDGEDKFVIIRDSIKSS